MSSLVEPEPVLLHRVELRRFPPPAHPLVVRRTDVVQGQIAACPIAAVMVAAAHARPDRVRQLLGAPVNGDVFSKRARDEIFRHWSFQSYQVGFTSGTPAHVTPVVYYSGQDVAYATTPNGPGWPSLIEKGYAIWKGRNSYNNIEQGGGLMPVPDAQTVLRDLVGGSDTADLIGDRMFDAGGQVRPLRDADLVRIARQAPRRPTIAASHAQGTQEGIVANHGYAVLRWRNGRVVLRNPWGGAGAEPALSLGQLRANFQAVWQAT